MKLRDVSRHSAPFSEPDKIFSENFVFFEIRAIRAVVLLGNPHFDNVVLIFMALQKNLA